MLTAEHTYSGREESSCSAVSVEAFIFGDISLILVENHQKGAMVLGFWQDMKKEYQEEKEKQDAKEQAKEEARQNESETEKFAKTGNFLIKGVAFWYLIPFFTIVFIIGLFVVVWIWDMIF